MSFYDACAASSPRMVYPLKISVDNFRKPLFHSQQTSTDVILSMMYGISYTQELFHYNESTLSNLLTSSLLGIAMILNHEYTGHGLTAQTYERPIVKIGFINPLIAYCLAKPPATYPYLQKDALYVLGGIQSSTVLSHTIFEHFFQSNASRFPSLIGDFVLHSTLDQLSYISSHYSYKIFASKSEFCRNFVQTNDLSQYIDTMQSLYGKDTINHQAILKWSLLDLINPLAINFFKKDFLENSKLFPLLHLVLTPYNVLEKRLTLFYKLPPRLIKLTFGFGKEQKSNQPFFPNHCSIDFIEKIQSLQQPTPELFAAEVAKNSTSRQINTGYTVYIGLSCSQLLTVKQCNIGMNIAGWRQPKLFTASPLTAPMQLGGMCLFKFNYHFTKKHHVFCEIGYKSTGFVLGYTASKTAILRGGMQYNLAI